MGCIEQMDKEGWGKISQNFGKEHDDKEGCDFCYGSFELALRIVRCLCGGALGTASSTTSPT
jgi:hypothetical protein